MNSSCNIQPLHCILISISSLYNEYKTNTSAAELAFNRAKNNLEHINLHTFFIDIARFYTPSFIKFKGRAIMCVFLLFFIGTTLYIGMSGLPFG